MPHVYILRCRDGSFYTGSTTNLELRMAQHEHGEGSVYTSQRLPVTLVWESWYDRVDEAFHWERRIHGWSRAKKLALIEGRYDDLPGYSRRERIQRENRDAEGDHLSGP